MHISKRGDCIIAVKAEKGLVDLSQRLKGIIRNEKAKITFSVEAGGSELVIKGQGHSDLMLSDASEMVIRKSDYICDRTLMIKSDMAASDIPHDFVKRLQTTDREVHIRIKAIL